MKQNKIFTCSCSILISVFLFYYSVYTPLIANYTFAKFLNKRVYNSYDDFLNAANKNLSFEIPFITLGISDFAKSIIISPQVNQEFAFKVANQTAEALRKIQKKAPEDYNISFALADLLIKMSARDKKYLSDAEASVSHCLEISPNNLKNDLL